MIPNAGEILNPSAPDKNNRVFLQIMTDSGDIGSYFCAMGKPNTGHLAERGIGLFGGNGHYPGTNTPFLGAGIESR